MEFKDDKWNGYDVDWVECALALVDAEAYPLGRYEYLTDDDVTLREALAKAERIHEFAPDATMAVMFWDEDDEEDVSLLVTVGGFLVRADGSLDLRGYETVYPAGTHDARVVSTFPERVQEGILAAVGGLGLSDELRQDVLGSRFCDVCMTAWKHQQIIRKIAVSDD